MDKITLLEVDRGRVSREQERIAQNHHSIETTLVSKESDPIDNKAKKKTRHLSPPEEMDKIIERRTLPLWIIFIIFSTLIGTFFWGSKIVFFNNEAYIVAVDKTLLDIATVEKRLFLPTVVTAAQIQPSSEYFVENKDAGRVEKVFFRSGEKIKKGEPILKLTNTDLLLSVLRLETEVAEQVTNLSGLEISYNKVEVEYDLEITRLNYEFVEAKTRLELRSALFKKGYISVAEIDELNREKHYKKSLLELRKQRRELELSERMTQKNLAYSLVQDIHRNLDIAKSTLDDLIVKSEIDGVLVSLDVELGQFKERGSALGKVYRMEEPKVIALLDEYYLPRLSLGSKARFKSLSGDSYELTLVTIFPEVQSGRVEMEFEFSTLPPEHFVSGQSIDIEIPIGKSSQDALILPNKDFMGQTGGQWAFVIEPDSHRAIRRSIVVGERSSNEIKILQGLKEGEHVIVSSYRDFSDASELNLE